MTRDPFPGLLKQVSRSFYLTLRALPSPVRGSIGLAYLLARATDTIADTEVLPFSERCDLLRRIRENIHGPDGGVLIKMKKLSARQENLAERELLERWGELWETLRAMPAKDQEHILEVLETLTSGQALDLERFGAAAPGKLIALQTDDDLDDYTYRVAGCVGIFWTKHCRHHLFPEANVDLACLFEEGVRFGKGLQLVNILRDLPHDLRAGRCYMPEERLQALGLRPEDLLSAQHEDRFRPLYESYLDRAQSHLQAGWRYTNRLPFRCVRVRLACAWPILIGLDTLALLRRATILDGRESVRISRKEVRRIVVRSVLAYPFPNLWHKLAS